MQRFILFACAISLASLGCAQDPLRQPARPDLASRLSARPDPGAPSALTEHVKAQASPRPALDPDASPDAYIRTALMRSPELEAAYQRWRAASERVPQVGALPDPRLSVGFFANEVETRVGPQQARIGISQSLPWFDGLRARKDAAAAQARAAWVDYLGAQLRLTREVASALYELRFLDRSIEVSEESLELLRSFEDSVRAHYRVGGGTHPDLVRVQVQLGLREDRLRQLRQSRPAMVARLNAMLDRAHDTPITPTGDLPIPPVDEPLETLLAIARQANPSLLAISERVETHRSLTQAARIAGRPELTVGVERIFTDEAINPAINESGDDPVLLSLSVNLPIWREKYDAGVRESIARRLAAASEHKQAASDLIADITLAHFRYTDAAQRESLYKHTLAPKAGEVLQSTLASYRTSESGFTDLIDAQHALLEFELAIERAHADRGIQAARLHELMGITDASLKQPHAHPEDTP